MDRRDFYAGEKVIHVPTGEVGRIVGFGPYGMTIMVQFNSYEQPWAVLELNLAHFTVLEHLVDGL